MAEANEHIQWAARLKDYASGNMTAAEMHALEEAAHADPFLMDALEGYVLMAGQNKLSDIDATLAALPQREEAKSAVKIVPLLSRGWVRWAVAASVVVLVGIGLFTQNQKNNSSNDLATNEPEAVTTLQSDVPAPAQAEVKDSFTAERKKVPAPGTIVRNADNLPQGSKPENRLADKTSGVAATTLSDDARTAPAKAAADAMPIMYSVNGKVVDEKSLEPIDNAVIELAGRQVISDPIGRFTIGAPALPAEIRVGAAGYRTKVVTWNQGATFLQVPLQKLPPTTEELIVTNLSEKRTNNSLVVVPNDTSLTAPVGGWAAFNNYFKQNMKAKGTSRIYKSVSMSFEIDANGTPTAIEITQSPGEEAKAEAIRLLQNGPKWRRGSGDTPMATITVKY